MHSKRSPPVPLVFLITCLLWAVCAIIPYGVGVKAGRAQQHERAKDELVKIERAKIDLERAKIELELERAKIELELELAKTELAREKDELAREKDELANIKLANMPKHESRIAPKLAIHPQQPPICTNASLTRLVEHTIATFVSGATRSSPLKLRAEAYNIFDVTLEGPESHTSYELAVEPLGAYGLRRYIPVRRSGAKLTAGIGVCEFTAAGRYLLTVTGTNSPLEPAMVVFEEEFEIVSAPDAL